MLKLRPFQALALEALNVPFHKQNHVLCVAPTGSGKSLIYEKAANSAFSRTLLITPLVALARQQYKKLHETGIAVTLGTGGTSEGPPRERSGAWIISPETLSFSCRRKSLQFWKPNFLVVDECHCLWEWGETFRPAFSLIPGLLQDYSIAKSLWLTATLPFESRRSLREILPKPLIEIGEFDLPPHLKLEIQQVDWRFRAEYFRHWISLRKEPGLVFVATRQGTERIARLAESVGKRVLTYHGGMSVEERRNAEALVSNQIPDLIVATSAFGMGMNYPHLSYVVLWQAPTSLLSLVQTIGRAGRLQCKEAEALVLWDLEDFRLLEWTVQKSDRRRREILELLHFLETAKCRRLELKRYFDGRQESDTHSTSCGKCDICVSHEKRNRAETKENLLSQRGSINQGILD